MPDQPDQPERLRVLIADDHPLFRDGLRMLLATTDDLEVVAEARSADEAVALATLETPPPDVVVMDLQMPGSSASSGQAPSTSSGQAPSTSSGQGLSGIEATRRILSIAPQVHVLIVTMFEDDASIFAAMRAGARGYVLKDAAQEDVLRAIRSVGRGEAIFSPSIATRVLDSFAAVQHALPRELFPMLTGREREILAALARGCSNAEIAEQFHLTSKTVRNYVSAVLTKLQVVDRAEAILKARQAGLDYR